jgi:two-component system osmolarity sensor histidine kinase EnvZ
MRRMMRRPRLRPPSSRRADPVPRIGFAMPGGVFWRTFLLLALLIGASLAAWYQSFRIFERTPRAQQIAQTIVSVVNVTRSALIHSDPAKRPDLLADLASNESIRIYPLEPSDAVEPLRDTAANQLMVDYARARLGSETRIVRSVNGRDGLWVSFSIDDDDYWVAFERDRLEAVAGLQWLGWGAAALGLSLVGAVAMSRLINLPLKRLATAALVIGEGGRPAPLPEKGPREIRDANASFNAMVDDLARIEADRVLLLAGISHDLRTPLTRLRLEAEMSISDDDARQAVQADVDQMNAIINQFLDYARPMDEQTFVEADLAPIVRETVAEMPTVENVRITTDFESTAPIRVHRTEIQRVLFNLVENARRYGQTPGTGVVDLTIATRDHPPRIEVSDRGVGIPAEAIKRMKQPFTRLEAARSEANGAGLGLAIIERIAQRHRARFELTPRDGGGLLARLVFAKKA